MRVIIACDAAEPTGLIVALENQGVIVDQAEAIAELPAIVAASGPFDACVLKVATPAHETLLALLALRRRGLNIPVLILASKQPSPEAEAAALHAGADDLVVHPARISVLHARIQALARRARGYACPELRCGNVLLEQNLREVSVDGRRVPLTAREFDVLETLILHKGVLLTKERFMTSLYADGAAPDSKIVDVFVCKLRRKLAAAGAAEMIRTVWGRGYLVFDPTKDAVAEARAVPHIDAAAERAPRAWVRRAEQIRPAAN